MADIFIDMNNPEFQEDFFALEKNEQNALIKTLRKIRTLRWEALYSDPGLRWEAIYSKATHRGHRIYSLRFSKKYRLLAFREGHFLRLLSLHVDHDSAYQ